MYPTCWKFAVQWCEDATSTLYGYLLVDLNPDQDERYRLRTNAFTERCNTCMFASKDIGMLDTGWPFTLHYGEWLKLELFVHLNVICDKRTTYGGKQLNSRFGHSCFQEVEMLV